MKKVKRFIKKLFYVPSATLNTAARGNIEKFDNLLQNFQEPLLLNLGSGERFIGEESLKKQRYKKIVNFDISAYPFVNVMGDAHTLPFRESTFNGIVCQAVLEHIKKPEKAVAEMFRVLKKGGLVYAEVPFLQGFHPSPKDFYRFTLEGILQIFSRFSKTEAGVCVGPSSTLSWILREYLAGFLTGFSEKILMRKLSDFIAGWLTFPIKYLDYILAKKKGSHRIASGLYYLGRKE